MRSRRNRRRNRRGRRFRSLIRQSRSYKRRILLHHILRSTTRNNRFRRFNTLTFHINITIIFRSSRMYIYTMLITRRIFMTLHIRRCRVTSMRFTSTNSFSNTLHTIFIICHRNITSQSIRRFNRPFKSCHTVISRCL